MPRKHVLDATLDGFRAAIRPAVAAWFCWESTDQGPALLFLGIGPVNGKLSQDTWFTFSADLQSVTYLVRLTQLDEDRPNYGESLCEMKATLSLEDAANLLDMCIEQVQSGVDRTAESQRRASLARRDD